MLNWIDPHDHLRYASLQGKTARPFLDILPALGAGDDSMATLVIGEGKTEVFTHSTAILKALAAAGGLAGFLGFLLRLVPTVLRDFCYRYLAKNRMRLFGKGDVCEIMKPELKSKLLG